MKAHLTKSLLNLSAVRYCIRLPSFSATRRNTRPRPGGRNKRVKDRTIAPSCFLSFSRSLYLPFHHSPLLSFSCRKPLCECCVCTWSLLSFSPLTDDTYLCQCVLALSSAARGRVSQACNDPGAQGSSICAWYQRRQRLGRAKEVSGNERSRES